jgi:DAK2 domain fusion protein YloV
MRFVYNRPMTSLGGRELKDLLAAAVRSLELNAPQLDAWNVFPVPDGDTGLNMLQSMRAAVREAQQAGDDIAETAQALAEGALRGARGNSGIILSQFWQGLAQGLAGKKTATSCDLSRAFRQARDLAYSAVSKPTEGTILTVMHDVAAAAAQCCARLQDLRSFLDRIVRAARVSVARTPSLLAVLRGAGVVDSGAQGLLVILEGALGYLRRGPAGARRQGPSLRPRELRLPRLPPEGASPGTRYGYCTEFLLRGAGLDLARIKGALEPLGDSLVVAGGGALVRVHIHAPDPQAVFAAAGALGAVEAERAQDLDRGRPERARAGHTLLAGADGRGFMRLFESLGAVPADSRAWRRALRRLVRRTALSGQILLPNSAGNLDLLRRLRRSGGDVLAFVPTKTIPQGIAAALAFDPHLGLEANLARMERAAGEVRTIEIRRAGTNGRFLGFVDGERVAEGPAVGRVLQQSLEGLSVREAEVATVYYRRLAQAREAVSLLRSNYPALRVESYAGGHPACELVISIE